MNCKICGMNMYQNIDIRSIFKANKIHIKCEYLLERISDIEVIPITNNMIHFDYFFLKKEALNYEFLSLFLTIKQLLKYLDPDSWSAIYIYEEEEYISLSNEAKYLLLHLGQKPIVFISMFAY